MSMSMSITTDEVLSIRLSGLSRSDDKFTDSICVNGLNLNNTVSDFVDAYGVLTNANVNVNEIGDVVVEYVWDNPIKYSDYVLSVTAVVYVADEESFNYWVSDYILTRK